MNQLIKPVFDFSDTSVETVLKIGTVKVSTGNYSFTSSDAKAVMNFVPTPRIRIKTELQKTADSSAELAFPDSIKELSLDGISIDGFCTNLVHQMTRPYHLVDWIPRNLRHQIVGNDSTDMDAIIFHLFNFPEFHNSLPIFMEGQNGNRHLIHLLKLENEIWTINIQSVIESSKRLKQSNTDGSYQLTHVGSIEKKDGSIFKGEEADNILRLTYGFLSFAKGSKCDLVCPTGFNAANMVWQKWDVPSKPSGYIYSWFTPHELENLISLFPKYTNIWNKGQWDDALLEVIYWYLNANDSSRGIDAGIILTQASLERLSFEYAVRHKMLLLTKGFKDLWASDKFRLLFSSLNIPLEIPSECKKLHAYAATHNWLDAPHALTEIRNSLVHPEHKKHGQLKEIFYEAWLLGLWFLELSILAVCEYKGTYSNRLKNGWEGQYDNTPWIKDDIAHE